MGELNNILKFDDFDQNWESKKQKSTKRTDVGLDIIEEGKKPSAKQLAAREKFKKMIAKKQNKVEDKEKKVKESNEPGVNAPDLEGNNKIYEPNSKLMGFNKFNNLLNFDDFTEDWQSKKQKSTPKTDVGLDVLEKKATAKQLEAREKFKKMIAKKKGNDCNK